MCKQKTILFLYIYKNQLIDAMIYSIIKIQLLYFMEIERGNY